MKRYCSPLTCSLFLSCFLAARPESTHQRRYEGLFATEKRVSRYRTSCASFFFFKVSRGFPSFSRLEVPHAIYFSHIFRGSPRISPQKYSKRARSRSSSRREELSDDGSNRSPYASPARSPALSRGNNALLFTHPILMKKFLWPKLATPESPVPIASFEETKQEASTAPAVRGHPSTATLFNIGISNNRKSRR